MNLFHEESDPFFGGCNHAGLLWALETLAWSTQFLPDVFRALLRLAEYAPHGRWANRPDATLCEVLRDWIPHTTAGVNDRIQLLDILVQDCSETAWELLLKLLPGMTGGISHPTHHPMWRDWANAWTRGATHAESLKFITAVGERVIRQAGSDARRWKQVYENLGRVPYAVHEQLIAATSQLADSNLSDPDRRLVSDELSGQISRHRCYHEADWSLPSEVLDALESALAALKPSNCVFQHAWLFDQWPGHILDRRSSSHEENQQALEMAREEAVREIYQTLGFDGVESLMMQAGSPEVVGFVLARESADRFLSQMIPRQISLSEKSLAFARGFIRARFYADGWDWADGAIDRCVAS